MSRSRADDLDTNRVKLIKRDFMIGNIEAHEAIEWIVDCGYHNIDASEMVAEWHEDKMNFDANNS